MSKDIAPKETIASETSVDTVKTLPEPEILSVLDSQLYDKKVLLLAHDSTDQKWPVKAPYPKAGALLPFNRIVAYYGNLYTPGMGILGSKPSNEMLKNLMKEVDAWNNADPSTPVIPALHYIAVTAQSKPGASGLYRLRMSFQQIDKVLELAKQIDAITFLDIQVGHSDVMKEVPPFEEYLKMPNVHLGIDPEWSMKTGHVPGKKIGTMDAKDINFVIDYLADLVKKYDLPPKVLVVHRFTRGMITNYKSIKTCPEVQIVINMDGFGFPAKKVSTYRSFIAGEPIQFTGFKLFYKNDKKDAPYRLMTHQEILGLRPRPIYIQYQ
ncbi:MAG: hypothetical protein IPM42_09020 [Saprospiraceae bacterium]|nr:hypothetical protein [Saprospiraceae bacterium]